MDARMPTKAQAEVLAHYDSMTRWQFIGALDSCIAAGWMIEGDDAVVIAEDGRAALARYREAHPEGRA